MRRLGVLLALLLALGAFAHDSARADGGDETRIERTTARIGGPVSLDLVVVTEPGSTVEVNNAFPGWNNVEVVSTGRDRVEAKGGQEVHHVPLVVAGFLLGEFPFQPAVTVVRGTESSQRVLPQGRLQVVSSLDPGAPLELSPLAGPRAIDGGPSPLLLPAIVAGSVLGLLLLSLAGLIALRLALRRRPPSERAPEPALAARPLDAVESLMQGDVVAAYRLMSATVRHVLSERYALPARALTSVELERRLGDRAVDRIQARLVGGLLEECDAVLYAGYRPATGRRMADLDIAREIVEGGA